MSDTARQDEAGAVHCADPLNAAEPGAKRPSPSRQPSEEEILGLMLDEISRGGPRQERIPRTTPAP